ncbi:MAG: riboflavin synthase [Acidimicrobiia bacterium]
MFTGIVSATGAVQKIEDADGGLRISIESRSFFGESKIGDSVSINGVCLTIEEFTNDLATFFVQIETLKKTTLNKLEIGSIVNLEHPLRLNDRLGGHIVQGHVDSVGTVSSYEKLSDGSVLLQIEIKDEISMYVIDKGSICINGVSLTVAEKNANKIKIGLILETLAKTSFAHINVGDKVNVEVDLIGKYVENMINKSEM